MVSTNTFLFLDMTPNLEYLDINLLDYAEAPLLSSASGISGSWDFSQEYKLKGLIIDFSDAIASPAVGDGKLVGRMISRCKQLETLHVKGPVKGNRLMASFNNVILNSMKGLKGLRELWLETVQIETFVGFLASANTGDRQLWPNMEVLSLNMPLSWRSNKQLLHVSHLVSPHPFYCELPDFRLSQYLLYLI